MPYLVDFVIAVHDARRPIARAVASVLAAGLDSERLRVTVVCHNIDREQIAAALGPELAGRVRLLELKDGIHSPAGPFTHGIEAADARSVSIMGSDDYLEPGALGAWAELAAQRGLDVVIPVQRHPSRAVIRNPVVRFRRVSPLDPLKDRLVYRTSPIGLISTALVRRAGLRLTAGVPTGEDQEFSIRLALSGAAIGYAWGRPAYSLGDDAADRTTQARRPVDAEFDALLRMLRESWFAQFPLDDRRAVAVKYVRIHLLAFVRRRLDADDWTEAVRVDLAALVARLDEAAPGFRGHLSIADVRALRALAEGVPPAELHARVIARSRFGTPSTVLPSRIGAFFAADAPPRFIAASVLMSR